MPADNVAAGCHGFDAHLATATVWRDELSRLPMRESFPMSPMPHPLRGIGILGYRGDFRIAVADPEALM